MNGVHVILAWCGLFGAASGVFAVEPDVPPDVWDRLWAAPVLRRDANAEIIQEAAIIGQLQTQYACGIESDRSYGTQHTDASQRWGDVEVRRIRLGMRAKAFESLSFLYLSDLEPDFEPRIYKRMPECYLTWAQSDALQLSAGKTELKFDREQEYSSKEFPLFERTALGNQFYGGELAGLWTAGKGIHGGWLYQLGLFSNDRQDEWTDGGGGRIFLGKIGYNYTEATSWDLAEVKFQLLYNSEPGFVSSSNDLASPLYSRCLSLSNEVVDGPFGLTLEAMWGDGDNGRADVFGLSAMPFWNLTSKLQWISCIELAASRQENGVFLPKRYEAMAPDLGDGSGDGYLATYMGVNYLLRGHDLKGMTGVKYSHLDGGTGGGGFNGLTWLTGVRIAF